jgi:hypothetical protein
MKQQDVKRLVIQAWDQWVRTQPIGPRGATGRDSLKFFFELQDTRPELLDFQSRNRDKWQVIHGWLLGEQRVSD